MPEGWKRLKKGIEQNSSIYYLDDVIVMSPNQAKRMELTLTLMKEMAETLEYISEESNDPRACGTAHEILQKFGSWK